MTVEGELFHDKEALPNQRSSTAGSNDDATVGSVGPHDEEKQPAQPTNEVAAAPEIDPINPQSWSMRKKSIQFFVVFMNSFISYFSSAVYIPALTSIQAEFNTNITTMNATIALFIMVSGVAPLFWGPLSEIIGRRWVYIISTSLYTVFTVICGISNNLPLFFVMRLMQGICASAGQAVGGGSLADMFVPSERGRAMGVFMLGTILGPTIGPLVGGYVNQYIGWRWIFYIKTIMGGVIAICNVVIMRETFYPPADKAKPTFNPLNTLSLLLRPEIFLTCLPMSVAFGWFYLLLTILPESFAGNYGFGSGSIGLCYLASGVGNSLGAVISGLVSDRLYVWLNRKTPKKENRLVVVYLGLPFFVVGCFMYGWFLQYNLQYMAPLMGIGVMAVGMMTLVAGSNTYLVDSFTPLSASVMSVGNFTRNILAMMFSLLAVQIDTSLGHGWTYSLMGFINLAFFVTLIPLVQIKGAQWREAAPWWKK